MSAGPTVRALSVVRSRRDEFVWAVWDVLVMLASSVEAADDLARQWYEFFQTAMVATESKSSCRCPGTRRANKL